MEIRRRSESGQALVLLALGVVALLGFASLAIDGGMVYADRRHAQNAADSAALAAALAKVNDENLYTAGFYRANSNGYDNNGTTNTVEVYNPPISGQYAGNSQYIQVFITAQVDTALVHFVYSGQVQNTVEAIARVEPEVIGSMYSGNALIGLKPNGCDVVWKHGNSGIEIDGGGVWVNSSDEGCSLSSGSCAGSLNLPDPYTIDVVGGSFYAGCFPNATVNENVPQYPYPPIQDIPEPTCNDPATWDEDTNTLSPGEWTGDFPPDATTYLEAGIYCITDNEFRLNANEFLEGYDVLLYMQSGGDITWNGGADIHLTGRSSGEYKGLVIYISHQNYTNPGNCEARLNGSEDFEFEGTIYAPTCDIVFLGGGGSDGWRSQVIGYTVELGGNSDFSIFFEGDDNYEADFPAEIELTK